MARLYLDLCCLKHLYLDLEALQSTEDDESSISESQFHRRRRRPRRFHRNGHDRRVGHVSHSLTDVAAGLLDNVQCMLEPRELWKRFHELGTEMIITKSGR